jgi:8-oxo-dGTP pyrophosphatase MutT (NUDIX family)
MSSRAQNPEIIPLDRVEIAVEPWQWEFAVTRRDEIERHFAGRRREQPALWNGRVLLLNRYGIDDGILRGSSFETDFASFLAWRDWGFPDRGVFNIFAAAALRAADGAYLVGEMAASTASAGQLYFPCGTPDPEDISAHGALDLAGSVGRELLEETGLDIRELAAEPGWTLVRDSGFLALMKRLTADRSAQELRARIMRHLDSETQPEFSDIRIVRGPTDFHPRMPRFVVAYLEAMWRR